MPSYLSTEFGTRYREDDPGRRYGVTLEEEGILCCAAQRRHVIEFGTGLGLSTRAMADAAESVVTVDPDPWVAENVDLPNNVQFCKREPEAGYFTMGFVDGEHSYPYVKSDLEFCLRHVHGPIFVHDYELPDVKQACDDLLMQPSQVWGARPMLARFENDGEAKVLREQHGL